MLADKNKACLLPVFGLVASLAAVVLAVLAKLLLVNEYAAQGIPTAYDCDGPLVVGFFMFAAFGVGIVGAVASVLKRGPTWMRTTALSLCGVAFLLAATESREWRAESVKNEAEGSPCR